MSNRLGRYTQSLKGPTWIEEFPKAHSVSEVTIHRSEPERGRAREQERGQERKSFIAYIFRSKKQEPEQEREWRNPVPFKENYPLPRTCRSLIGCSPSAELSSRGRQSTWGGKLPLAHAQIICLPLRTQDVSAILQRRM